MCRRDPSEKFCYRYDKNIIGEAVTGKVTVYLQIDNFSKNRIFSSK